MIHGRRSVHHGSETVLGAGREKKGLDKRSLPRSTVSNHCDVPYLGRIYQRHDSSSPARYRLCYSAFVSVKPFKQKTPP
jgi:hypothetical protein